MLQRMVRPGHRTARQQQDQRIDQRQIKRIKCLNTLWRPYATYGKKRTIKEGPEEGDKEHHLGCDEQHHPVAHANLHNRCVMPLIFGLTDDVAPPHEHGHQHQCQTKPENGHAMRHLMHIHDAANRCGKGRGSANGRPRACLDKMVRVFVCTAHSLLLSIWSCLAAGSPSPTIKYPPTRPGPERKYRTK